MKRIARLIGIVLPLTVAFFFAGACGDDDRYYGDCIPGDPATGASCECRAEECVCPSSGDCAILCVEACDLQCAGSGNCDFACDVGCNVACTGSGNCDIDVGDDGFVDCPGPGNCTVDCDGDCRVRCTQGTCTVFCEPGFDCSIEECPDMVEECPEDVLVCGGTCP